MSNQHRRSTVNSFSLRLLICLVSLAALVDEATASNRQKHEARPQSLSRGVATTAQGSVSHSRHSHTKHEIFTRNGEHCHRMLCHGL
jgi:hypothetical protein